MSLYDMTIAAAEEMVKTFWSPVVDKELRENTLWTGLFQDPNYTIESSKGGTTHKIKRIKKSTSVIKTIGTDANTFEANLLESDNIDLVVNKRCVSAYEFDDLSEIFSQVGEFDSEIKEALLADVRQQANGFIKSLVVPSSSSPTHVITSVTDFNLAQLSAIRTLAAVAKWKSSGQSWLLLADPTYYSDLLDDTTLSNSQSMGVGKSPLIDGMFEYKRHGFNIAEDDSLSTDTAYAMLGNALKVIIGEPRFKISDLHSNSQFGYKISVDFVLGGVQMEDTRVISIAN